MEDGGHWLRSSNSSGGGFWISQALNADGKCEYNTHSSNTEWTRIWGSSVTSGIAVYIDIRRELYPYDNIVAMKMLDALGFPADQYCTPNGLFRGPVWIVNSGLNRLPFTCRQTEAFYRLYEHCARSAGNPELASTAIGKNTI